ncbi:hypothetical protein [Frigidibacter sp. MR17.24]|uniref:hypothetical protein n=1 Tax=Frigidibacter sp. MR17.24 TaxID=3127345 RepID=UPI003012B04F
MCRIAVPAALAALAALAGSAAVAQDDAAMEVQRCVWRCLADSRDATDPAYQQCIDTRCNERVLFGSWGQGRDPAAPAAVAPPPPGLVPGWSRGRSPALGEGVVFALPSGAAIGLGCSGLPATPLALRWTAGLLPGAAEAVAVIGATAAVPVTATAGAAVGDACAPPLRALLAGATMALVPGRAVGQRPGGGVVLRRPDGAQIVLSLPEEAPRHGGTVIPTAGALGALRQQAAACTGAALPRCPP